MFTTENTTGYTADQLAALNAERAERLAGLDADSDEYQQADKSFNDEVAGR